MKNAFCAFFIFAIVSSCILSSVFAQSSEYKVQSSDVITITVHNQPDLTTKTRVTKEGNISFPLLGQIKVQGLTVHEVEQDLKARLEKDYLVSAQVLVFIEAYHARQISVVGEVKSPGKFDIPSEKPATIMQAIGMAGGFTKEGDVKNVTVMRVEDGSQKTIKINTKDITIRGEKDKDIVVEPGDVISVPEGFSQVSVIGEVKKPGKYDMPQEKNMTLLEAIAMAEGFTKDAEVTKVKVMRLEGSQKKTIMINTKDITEKDQKDKDIILEAGDIVYVPESFF